MPDFAFLRSVCKSSSRVAATVLDDFLMYYVVEREGLEREMDQQLARFRKATVELEEEWINLFKAQYIGHRIFREGGYIKKYLRHVAVKERSEEELDYLQQQAKVPWRFSFAKIIGKPATDFYEMLDVFTLEKYILYSPSMSKLLKEGKALLWFNLISYNGHCWQSYGPVIDYLGFDADDIYFFGTELNQAIEYPEDLMADVESNPFPYMMLINGARFPRTAQGDFEIFHVVSEFPVRSFDEAKFRKLFTTESAQGILRVASQGWSEPPHFAVAHYDKGRKMLQVNALTEIGFREFIDELNKFDLDLEPEPEIMVRIPMLICIKKILGKEVELNPYERLFEPKRSPKEQDQMKRLNSVLAMALPFINSGEAPDIESIARETGVDEETTRQIITHALGSVKELQGKIDKKMKKKKGR